LLGFIALVHQYPQSFLESVLIHLFTANQEIADVVIELIIIGRRLGKNRLGNRAGLYETLPSTSSILPKLP
jgi:hypothetical protein